MGRALFQAKHSGRIPVMKKKKIKMNKLDMNQDIIGIPIKQKYNEHEHG